MARKRPEIPEALLAGATVKSINVEAIGGVAPDAKGGNPRSKYGAKPTVYAGVRYASKAEAKAAEDLDLLKRIGAVRFWIGQPKFRLGVPENVYQADFLVVTGDGQVYAVDVKGMETAKFRRDRKLWKKYGEFPLHIIKGSKVEVVIPESFEE